MLPFYNDVNHRTVLDILIGANNALGELLPPDTAYAVLTYYSPDSYLTDRPTHRAKEMVLKAKLLKSIGSFSTVSLQLEPRQYLQASIVGNTELISYRPVSKMIEVLMVTMEDTNLLCDLVQRISVAVQLPVSIVRTGIDEASQTVVISEFGSKQGSVDFCLGEDSKGYSLTIKDVKEYNKTSDQVPTFFPYTPEALVSSDWKLVRHELTLKQG